MEKLVNGCAAFVAAIDSLSGARDVRMQPRPNHEPSIEQIHDRAMDRLADHLSTCIGDIEAALVAAEERANAAETATQAAPPPR